MACLRQVALFQKAIGPFHQEYISSIAVKCVTEQAFGQCIVNASISIRCITLVPYQVQLTTWLILPTCYQVRIELHKIKIRIVEAIVCNTIGILVHIVLSVLPTDLCGGKPLISVIVAFSHRIGYIRKATEQWPRNERLTTILKC